MRIALYSFSLPSLFIRHGYMCEEKFYLGSQVRGLQTDWTIGGETEMRDIGTYIYVNSRRVFS